MGFDEQIRTLINEAEVPERLEPENIALMLKEKTAQKKRKEIKQSSTGVKSKNTAIAIRSTATLAACIALTFGVVALVEDMNAPTVKPEITQENKASDYHDVYSVIQDTIINNPSEGSEEISAVQIPNTTDMTTITSEKNKDYVINAAADKIEKADIVKTDGTNLYYIANGTLYFVSAENGKMSEISKIKTDDKTPVDMYIEGNKLIVISNNTVEVPYETSEQPQDTTSAETTALPDVLQETTTVLPSLPQTVIQNNTVVDVYDITDKTSPKQENTYKQNGAYISSGMTGTDLYLVTNYSNFRTKPLQNEEDLDNYIPTYYIGDNKYYVSVEDIIIPSKASSSYTIVSGLNVEDAALLKSTKAVLVSGKSVLFTDKAIYVAGSTTNSNGKAAISAAKFSISGGSVSVPSIMATEGIYSAELTAMSEYNGSLVITGAANEAQTGVILSVIDDKFEAVSGKTDAVAAEDTIEAVCINGSSAYVLVKDETAPIEISFAEKANPTVTESTDKNSVYLYKFSEGKYFGLSAIYDENGKQNGIKLTMYSSSDGKTFTEISSSDISGTFSAAVCSGKVNSQAFVIDIEKNIIGIPTVSKDTYGDKNIYSVFSFDDDGFKPAGTIEYTDLEEKFKFNRAVRIGDTLYAFSDGRIVSAQVSDLAVVGTIEIN